MTWDQNQNTMLGWSFGVSHDEGARMPDDERLGQPVRLTQGAPVPPEDATTLSDGWQLDEKTEAEIRELEANTRTTTFAFRTRSAARGYR